MSTALALPATARHSVTLAGRAVRKIARTPEQLIDVTLQPVIFVLLFVYVFGGAITGSRHDYLEYVLPAILVQTVVFSSVAIGVNLNADVEKGVFDRFRSLPIPRSAPLIGAVLGDVVRYVVSCTVLTAVGFALGFRLGTNPVEGLLALVVAVLFALSLCWVSVFLGLVLRTAGSVQGVMFLVMFPLTFGSNAFVQADTLPGWLQSWTRVNPVTHLVDAVRGLTTGGAVAEPLLVSAAWAVGLVVVFLPLATRAYRRKA
ncbi:oleandomycin transport system permease protein [Motilibacter peucedani]|uniref:Transport permease protein n=1 Tax=Motilibacter peucedani TaxID=598650 RepID=A0A420XMR9_9ACTN|nr:ABC transporter permease [Motilibacter peucedani]RKS72573.1 oleandomycin transport system permease protein [Motilibacter peucedani]